MTNMKQQQQVYRKHGETPTPGGQKKWETSTPSGQDTTEQPLLSGKDKYDKSTPGSKINT